MRMVSANIDKAITLGVKEPEKASFNRAFEHESLAKTERHLFGLSSRR